MSQTPVDSVPNATTGTPRWVKAFGIVALILVLLYAVLHLTGMGPRSHMPHTEHGVPQP